MKKVTKLSIGLIAMVAFATKTNYCSLTQTFEKIENKVSFQSINPTEGFDLKTLIFAKFGF